MESTSRDILFMLMLEFDLNVIIHLCSKNSKINREICNNRFFWKRKLEKEYPKIDITNVIEFKKLYLYLKNKPGINNDALPKIGNLSPDGNSILGTDRTYYPANEIIKSNLIFPTYPPEYFLPLGTDNFVISNHTLTEMITNLVTIAGNKISFITGPYNESYRVVFTNTKHLPTASFVTFRLAVFKDGEIYY